MQEIPNADLTPADIPPPDAGWFEIGNFALTFNGYKISGDQCAEIANAQRHDSLTDLRTCLFFEQRRWRHFGQEPEGKALEYIRGVVEKIRERVAAGES